MRLWKRIALTTGMIGGRGNVVYGIEESMKAVIFDAFGTLFKVTDGGSARTIRNHILVAGVMIDEAAFLEEWKAYYKKHTSGEEKFLTEREIFIARIQMFYDRYGVDRSAEADADALLAGAFEREAYPEVREVLAGLMERYRVFIGSNTDNDVLENVMRKNDIRVHKVYTSEDLKCYKPNPKFFEKILKDNGLSAQEALFVGDSITDDVLGPKAVGMKTVWVDRKGVGEDVGQDGTVAELSEIWEVIR